MAINFPNSPSNGDVFGNYTYDTSIPGWRKTPENSASLPAGTIVQWPGATAPANWLLADGAAVSRITYASLFAAIGVQYGSGDGTTTFNLPNLKGRVAVGLDSSQTEFDVLGETGGAKTHTLTTAEMPSHNHDNTIWNPGYTSGIYNSYRMSAVDNVYTNGAVLGQTASKGGGGAHNNLQPYIVLNYIIKTSAGITSGDSELATRVGAVENANNLTPLSQNYLINGAFDMWQRGTSFSHSGGSVSSDMWREYTDSGSGTQSKDTTDYPSGLPLQSYKFTAGANSTNWVIWQIIESMNCADILGQTVTFSVYLKSSVARTFRLSLGVSTTVDATWTGSWTTQSFQDFSVTTSWARYAFTTVVPSTARTLQFSVASNGANMASASTINVAGAQVERGSFATLFRRNSPSIQAELLACQRYYQRFGGIGGSDYTTIGTGQAQSNTIAHFMVPLYTAMRAFPTLSYSAVSDWGAHRPGQTITQASTLTAPAGMSSTNMAYIYMTYGADGSYGANVPVMLSARGLTAAWMALSAEL